MTTTSPVIILTMSNALLSSVSSPDIHSRADIDDLLTGEAIRGLKYATYEPNKWLLDGSFHFAPDPAHLGFVSQDISGAAGVFVSDQVLTLTLDAVVDIEQGITLEFSNISGDYATAVNVEYQDAVAAPIDDDDYVPTGYNFFAEAPTLPVADVKYIIITLSETSEAYRHIKLLDVYVDGVLFDKSNIREANTIEEINPVSIESPSDKLDFTLYSPEGDFSIVNPQGVYAGLKKNQIVDAYEFVDDIRIYMGRFYLKKWDSLNEKLATFECIDAIFQSTKVLNFIGGENYYVQSGGTGLDIDARTIDLYLNFAFLETGLEYSVDASLSAEIITGFIDIETSIRDTLRLIGHGARAYITSARSKVVNIIPSTLVDDVVSWDYIFTDSDIGEDPTITLRPLVTGIDLTAHSFPVNGEHVDFQVYDGTVTNGVRLFKLPSDFFGDGSWLRSGSSTSIVSSADARFIETTTTAPGTLIVSLNASRVHEKEIIKVRTSGLPVNTAANILTIKESTLVTPYNMDDVLDFNDGYFQQRYVCEFELFASLVEVGNAVKVPIQGEIFGGIVEKIESDLAGGFVQKVTAVGNIL